MSELHRKSGLAFPRGGEIVPAGRIAIGPVRQPLREGDTASRSPSRLRVAVLVDLLWRPDAGGHVKCWERLAHAAARRDDLDLTVHFSGERTRTVELSDSVRYEIHRPVLSTARFSRLIGHVPDHTDLAPYHPGLARRLRSVDVIHTTDAFFAFAKTAARVARRSGIPIVNSVHTDTPNYTHLFAQGMARRVFGAWIGQRMVLDLLKADEWMARRMIRDLARHQAQAAYALVASEKDRDRLCRTLPAQRVHVMRRGIDRETFNPRHRDRAWLAETYGVPQDRKVILFVGRLDCGKRVLRLAKAVRLLLDSGRPVHLFCAGRGPDRDAVASLLGDAATLPGFVASENMSRVYASADILAMPSDIEVFANVVPEAMSSGLPVVISARSGMGRLVTDGETGHVVAGEAPEDWAETIAAMVDDDTAIPRMGRAARTVSELLFPSWDDVLAEDLLPLWRAAVAARSPA
jgi:glycosyltransferase involved in cell wall biosynthesis